MVTDVKVHIKGERGNNPLYNSEGLDQFDDLKEAFKTAYLKYSRKDFKVYGMENGVYVEQASSKYYRDR